MQKIICVLLIFTFPFYSCKQGEIKAINIDNETRVEGNINIDTIYNGLIKFYNIKSNKLFRECNYENGIENGKCILYHKNGKIAYKYFFENGKVNGDTYAFDVKGDLLSKGFYYYDIRVGSSDEYIKEKIANYYFYSLDGELLFFIYYDSSQKKKITDLQSDYFFYHTAKYQEYNDSLNKNEQQEYFLYLPNPPEYNFRYSLVIIDSDFNVLSKIQTFNNNFPWAKFTLHDESSFNKNDKIALRLIINDSMSNGDITMFKILK